MGLFRRRPPRQEYAVSAEALWGALKAGLPAVTSLVIRGPLVDLVRGMLVSARAGELKRAVEPG
jgi:hypothetical protein